MKRFIFVLLTAFGFLVTGRDPAVSSEKAKPHKPDADFIAGSQLWLEGNSSLRRYYLTAEKITAKSDLKGDSETKVLWALILNRKGHKLMVTLPVKNLKSGDPNMDQAAYDKLKAKDFPDIVFTLGDYEMKALPPQPYHLCPVGIGQAQRRGRGKGHRP